MPWIKRSLFWLYVLSFPAFAVEDTQATSTGSVKNSEVPAQSEDNEASKDVPILKEPEVPEPIAVRAKKANGLIEQRAARERATVDDPFVLTPHRPNYFLPFSFTHDPNDRESQQGIENDNLQDIEFQFQFSVKFPVATSIAGENTTLWFAYTQRSFWQAYNSNASAPFRDTNYEPEAFIVTQPDLSFFGTKLTYLNYGINHQSNGRQEPWSRSWNRLFLSFVFERENTVFAFRPWYRIPESSDDDNPDIERYLGYGDIQIAHVIDDVTYDVLLRNNLRSDNKGAIQLGVSFPLWGKVRGYAQYFEGYGQSMLDYDNYTRTLGLGFMLTGWL